MIYITHRAQIPPVILPILKGSQITCHQLVAGHRQPESTPRPGVEGPARLVETKGYCTTMALSTLHFLLVRGILRTGDGLVATPMSRRKERLFGSKGNGRLSLASAGMKLEMLVVWTMLLGKTRV